MAWNPAEWKLSTWLVGVAAPVGAVVALIQAGPVIADAQPLATKGYVLAQMAIPNALANVTRMDLLDFQITTLNNQLTSMKRQYRTLANNDPDAADLEVSIRSTQTFVDTKQRELNLLKCLVEQRVTCVQ